MSQEVKDLLNDPMKGTTKAQGILSYLFRHVLLWRQINRFSWNRRAGIWANKEYNKDIADIGNLNKALVQPEFSWATFKRAIDFLNPMGSSLSITLRFRDGHEITESVIIDPVEDESDPELNQLEPTVKDHFVLMTKKEPRSTLARLFRRILLKSVKSSAHWNQLMREYIEDPRNNLMPEEKGYISVLSSFQRTIFDERLSWNAFRRALNVLKPISVIYTLEMRWNYKPKDVTVHQVTVHDPVYIAEQNALNKETPHSPS